MSTETQTRLADHVQQIARRLSEGFDSADLNDDGEPMSAFDYLSSALDIEYIVNKDREYLGARVLVAFGGPNIWINTRTGTVEGYWWGEQSFASFEDGIGLDDALSEIYAC